MPITRSAVASWPFTLVPLLQPLLQPLVQPFPQPLLVKPALAGAAEARMVVPSTRAARVFLVNAVMAILLKTLRGCPGTADQVAPQSLGHMPHGGGFTPHYVKSRKGL